MNEKINVDFFNFSRVIEPHRSEIISSVNKLINHGNFILGPDVSEFEQAFSKKTNSKHAIGVSNGTDSLYSILLSLDLPKNSEVIVPAFTFIASASVIIKAGLIPVFVDIEKDKFHPNLMLISEKITKKTSAIIYVHLFGEHNNLTDLSNLCKKRGIHLIEDCAQSYGAPNGNYGIAGSFSFFPAKNLGCLGDGGAVITNSDNLAKKIKMIRKHGMSTQYQYEMLGGNFRLDTIQAAFLNIFLSKADSWIEKRKNNAIFYHENLSDIGDLMLPEHSPLHSYNQFTLKTKYRDNLKSFLKNNGISSNVYYPFPLYLNKFFKSKVFLKETEKACKEVLSIPVYQCLTDQEREHVSKTIKIFYKEGFYNEQ